MYSFPHSIANAHIPKKHNIQILHTVLMPPQKNPCKLMKNVYKINLHKHFLNTDNRGAVVGFHILTNCVYEYLIYWASFARVYLPFSYYVQNSHFIFHTVRNVVIRNAFDTCQQSRIMQGRRNRTPQIFADKLTLSQSVFWMGFYADISWESRCSN